MKKWNVREARLVSKYAFWLVKGNEKYKYKKFDKSLFEWIYVRFVKGKAYRQQLLFIRFSTKMIVYEQHIRYKDMDLWLYRKRKKKLKKGYDELYNGIHLLLICIVGYQTIDLNPRGNLPLGLFPIVARKSIFIGLYYTSIYIHNTHPFVVYDNDVFSSYLYV